MKKGKEKFRGAGIVEVTEELGSRKEFQLPSVDHRPLSLWLPRHAKHMAFETEAHYQRHSDGKDAARQGRQRTGTPRREKGAAGRRFCWCQKEDPPLRITLKETDVGLAGPPFRSRLASCP